MSSKRSQLLLSAGGLVLALGAGIMIGRISAPDSPAGSSGLDASSVSQTGSRANQPLSLAERVQQRKRASVDRDAGESARNELNSILSLGSRLDRTQRLLAFLDRLPTEEFAGVYEEMRNSPSADLQGSERSLILQAWAERDPLSALSFLQENGANDRERETAVGVWAANDPESAFAWASSAEDEGRVNNWLLGATRGIASTNPELARDFIARLEGRTRDEAIDEVEPYVTQFGFDYAERWIAGVADEEIRNRASREMARSLADLDPAQAGAWNAAIPDTDTRRDVSETVAERWARTDLAAARTWVDGLPEDTKSEAAEGVARHYARQDPAAAADWLAGLGDNPDLDGARQIFIRESFRNSPETSLDFVSNLSDARAQEGHYRRYIGGWMRRDEPAAREWLNSNANTLPPGVVERFNRQ